MRGYKLFDYQGDDIIYPALQYFAELQGNYAGMLGLLEIDKHGKHYQADVPGNDGIVETRNE